MRRVVLVLLILLCVGCATTPPPYAGWRPQQRKKEPAAHQEPSISIILLSAGVAAAGIAGYQTVPKRAEGKNKAPWLALATGGISAFFYEIIYGSLVSPVQSDSSARR
jgi:hypothetical protein